MSFRMIFKSSGNSIPAGRRGWKEKLKTEESKMSGKRERNNMLDIPRQYISFKFIRPISWPEIFEIWRHNEEYQDSWKELWQERGFSSWEEWRKAYANPISKAKLEWFLYEINDPLINFPLVYGVPSIGWIKKAYDGERTRQLKNLLNHPILSEYSKIIDLKKNFPALTTLTGIIYADKILIIEGMHRACALASWDKKRLFKRRVFIALARWNQKEIPIIGGNFKK